ncbi:MAG TPA: Ig domain-containing protein [Solirubrobacterales bacterium]|nr:Ig domain-containing protein [Solirubrobacterales bacterium]
MNRPVRRLKPLLVLVAFALLALGVSACATIKPESLQMSQPAGIGPVHVHFALCTEYEEKCEPNEDEGESQYMLVFAIPEGSEAPQTLTAKPVDGAAPIVYHRNEEVVRATSEFAAEFEGTFPPEGSEGVGYLSDVFTEEKGATREWTVDFDLSLPKPADGSPYGGPFSGTFISGWRKVDGTHPADRPVDCYEPNGPEPDETTAACVGSTGGEIGVSDLRIGAPPAAQAFVGGSAPLAYPFDFASTAESLAIFNLSAGSTLAGAGLQLSSPTYVPGSPDATTHRSPAASPAVTVAVPSTAQPGTYDVTITARTAGGATVSRVAKLTVTKPRIKLGRVKFNRAKGTATLAVGVPSAGTLTVAGKGIVKAKKKAKGAGTLKIVVRAKGKAKAKLEETGQAKVKAKISFKPSSGIAAKKTKALVLKKAS